MSGPPRQLTLDWPHAPSYAREDFLEAPGNAEALRVLSAWPNWAAPTLMLVGPTGSGKTHLGAIWARAADARIVPVDTLAVGSLVELASARALLIEDADRIGAEEAALFHLLNLTRESAAFLLMTARAPPDMWGLKTPDLLSRLRLAPIVSLGAPDLELSKAVLFKLFSDRQLVVDPAVVSYIALRIERSLDAARAIVAALDREALARGRAVTRAMAAEFLRDASSAD
ncbi:MAG TPA: DnaA/Hda family protein [Roseiarcus sp.]